LKIEISMAPKGNGELMGKEEGRREKGEKT
jgi:hypothetical protein